MGGRRNYPALCSVADFGINNVQPSCSVTIAWKMVT